MKKLWKKIKRFWKWYVLGYYHCDRCPYSWDDASPSCEDCDCGCVIFGDIRDTCRLLPPFRFLIGWGKKKRFRYAQAHEYDGLVDWYEERERKEAIMAKTISNSFEKWGLSLHHTLLDGTTAPVEDLNAEIEVIAHWVTDEYEQEIHPVQHRPLREEWKLLLGKTWRSFIRHFAPYFTKS